MKISTWAYSLKQGIINIKRNKLFSLASIATIAICIFLIGLFYSVFTNINNMITQAEEQISVTVFFKQGITDDEINSLKDKISQRAEVKARPGARWLRRSLDPLRKPGSSLRRFILKIIWIWQRGSKMIIRWQIQPLLKFS